MHRLDNGLVVLVQPTASPLAAAVLWLEAGTIDEAADEHGAAHFLEHMLFKGTGKHGIGGSTGAIEALGGELNAFTSYDETVLHAVVEADGIATAIDVLADMVCDPRLPLDELERERAVVLEEVRGYASDPDTVLEEATQALLFPGHAYGRPITANAAAVARLAPDAIARFRARHHGPDRAILAVAGGVDPDRVISAARAFAAWAPKGPRPPPPALPSPPRAQVHRIDAFEALSVELGWRAPPIASPDAAAIDVLVTALGDGPSSLLASRLVVGDAVATDAWSAPSSRVHGGSVSFGFPPRDGKTLAALTSALDEVAHVVAKGLPARFVRRAQDAIVADLAFAAESVDSIAHDLAYYTARHGDPAGATRYRAAIAAVSPADVHRVARAVLDPARVTAVVLDREVAHKRLAKVVDHAPVLPVPSREPVRHVFDGGAVVWVLPDASPVCAVHACVAGGALVETKKTQGLAEAWARAIGLAAAELDASQFGEAIDEVAGGIGGYAGRAVMGLRATFPAHHAAEGLDLFGSAWKAPRFDADDVERVKDELADDLRARADRGDEHADLLLAEALFPDHPWGFSPIGTARTIDAIGPGALHKLHGTAVTATGTVIAVSGGVDPDEVIEALAPWLEELPRGRRTAPGPVPPAAPREIHSRAGHGQAHVLVGVRGPAIDHPDRLPLAVVAALMDGQGGRLFLDLRERRGLAYDVWAETWAGPGAGFVELGLSCDPARAEDARAALIAAIDDLVDRPPDADEVRRYARMLRGRYTLSLERASARAQDCAEATLAGRSWGLAAHAAALAAVDERAVAAAVRWLAAPRTSVVVVPR